MGITPLRHIAEGPVILPYHSIRPHNYIDMSGLSIFTEINIVIITQIVSYFVSETVRDPVFRIESAINTVIIATSSILT